MLGGDSQCVDVQYVADRAVVAISCDRSNRSRMLHVWDDSCLKSSRELTCLFHRIPLYSCQLDSESYTSIGAHVYEIDERSMAIFVAYASTQALFMKKLFVVTDPISKVETIHDHQSDVRNAVGLKVCATSECCRLLVWQRTSVHVLDDDLNSLMQISLADYLTVKTNVSIASGLIVVQPAPMVLAVLKQGVLLAWNMDDGELIIQQDVSVDGSDEELRDLQQFSCHERIQLLISYRTMLRKYEIKQAQGSVLCCENAILHLPKALRQDLLTNSAEDGTSAKRVGDVLLLGCCVLDADSGLHIVVVSTEGVALCNAMLQKVGFTSLKKLGFEGAISSGSVGVFHRHPAVVQMTAVTTFQRSLMGLHIPLENIVSAPPQNNTPHKKQITPVKSADRMNGAIASPVDQADEEAEEELDFFRPVDTTIGRSLLGVPPPPSPPALGLTKRSVSSSKGPSHSRGDWEAPRRNSQGHVVDQPVTFHKNIRSSGYGQQIAAKQASKFGGTTKKLTSTMRSSSAPRMNRAGDAKSSNNSGHRIRMYPMDCGFMDTYQAHLDYPESVSRGQTFPPVLHMDYNGDGSRLALACHNNTVVALKLPKNSQRNAYDEISFAGHNNGVTSVCYSHLKSAAAAGKHMLLSASRDQTARLWSENNTDTSLINFSHLYKQADSVYGSAPGEPTMATMSRKPSGTSLKATSSTSTKSRNRPYGEDIKHAVFFYHDQFVLLTVKSMLLMYKYNADPSSNVHNTNDLTRFLHSGSYQLHHKWDFQTDEGSHNICALAAMNAVQSPLLMVSTTDKQVHVVDASSGAVARSFTHSHDKNLSSITLPTPSKHVSLPRNAYNIFLTNAPDNNILLYDLRTSSVSHRYAEHVHRREIIFNAISPNCKYIATGSEDNSVYVYDMFMQKGFIKHAGHRDVVTSVAFNPLFAQLASSGYDGKVKFHADVGYA